MTKALLERGFGIVGPPETLLPDMEPEFENKVFRQLCRKVGSINRDITA